MAPGLALPAQGQDQAPSSGSQQETQTPSENDDGIVIPAPLGGFVPQLTSAPETRERPNLLTGSIGLNALYTDNAFTADSRAVNDYQYSILPSLGFQTFGQRTQWKMHYAGGITLEQRSPGNSQQTHAAIVDLRHEFSRRFVANAREDYTMTNNPFIQIGASESLPTVAGPGQLGPLPVSSPVTRIGNVSTAGMSYQLSRHSGMGASGSYSLLRFRNAEILTGSGGSLIDTTNTAGRGFYLRQVSPHHTIGTEYQIQDLKFNEGVARTVDHTAYVFDSISFKGNQSLTLYAGPEFTHTHNAIIARPNLIPALLTFVGDVWSAAGGIVYSFQGKRNGLRISGDRGVSDGGGWSGAVRFNTASLEVERALGPRWTATISLSYSDGRTIGFPPDLEAGRITTRQAQIGFLCQLTRNLSATMQYARIQQPHAGLFTGTLNPDHNQVQAGLVYQFQRGYANERQRAQ